MAVIIDMDIPKSCDKCILRRQAFCFDGHHEPYLDKSRCPLKSADEMIEEIQDVYVGYRHAYEVRYDILQIIHKYTDKEQT